MRKRWNRNIHSPSLVGIERTRCSPERSSKRRVTTEIEVSRRSVDPGYEKEKLHLLKIKEETGLERQELKSWSRGSRRKGGRPQAEEKAKKAVQKVEEEIKENGLNGKKSKCPTFATGKKWM